MDELLLDGNAAAGLLQEVFGYELTTALSTCAGCGRVEAVGAVAAYVHAPGLVLRCPGCEQVLIRIVRGRGRYWLDMTGVRSLEIAPPATR